MFRSVRGGGMCVCVEVMLTYRFASARRSGEQERTTSHFLGADELDNNGGGLSGALLADEPGRDGDGDAILTDAEPLDMRVRRNALRLGRRPDLLDLHVERSGQPL